MSTPIIILITIFITGLMCISSGNSDGILIGSLLSGVSGVILGIIIIRKIIIATAQSSGAMTIKNEKEGYIELNKRTANNKKVLVIDAQRNINIKDHPAELVYTGVSMGGVTTGGFHVNEAYRTTSIGEKTGRYFISLRRLHDDIIVKKIQIQPNMVDSAKADPIVRQFLNGTTLTLKHNIEVYIPEHVKLSAANANASGHYDVAARLLREYTGVQELTKEECNAIVAWMSNQNSR